jgi:hypothetical protein
MPPIASRLTLLAAMVLLSPAGAQARPLLDKAAVQSAGQEHAAPQETPSDGPSWNAPWDAHAAAAVLDASFDSSDACEASLTQARAAESTPSADIDPRLRDLFTHARCTPVASEEGVAYAMRLHWPRSDEAG